MLRKEDGLPFREILQKNPNRLVLMASGQIQVGDDMANKHHWTFTRKRNLHNKHLGIMHLLIHQYNIVPRFKIKTEIKDLWYNYDGYPLHCFDVLSY